MSTKDKIISIVNNVASDQRKDPAIWKDKELTPAKQRQTIKGTVGKGYKAGTPQESGGGSIASPLTETTGTRTHWAEKLATSSDGLFVVHYYNDKQITTKDANNKDVKLILDDV